MHDHLLQQTLRLGGNVRRQARADKNGHGVAVRKHVVLHHRLVDIECLVLVLELLALLQVDVEHHHVGVQTATLRLFHHERRELDGIA